MPSLVKGLRRWCRNILERNSPYVSPHASDDEGDAPGADNPGDGGKASDDEGDAETVPDEEQENDDAELHQVCAILQDQHETGDE